jgi:hypothetical protein
VVETRARKRCLKSSRHDLECWYAAKHRTSERSACTVAGRDPRSPEGDLARKQRAKWGRARPGNDFCRVQFWSVFHRVFLGLEVLRLFLVRTGRRTRCRTILGSSRSAIHTGFVPENVVVTGQEMGAEPPLRCRLVRSQEGLQGLFLRPSCGPFPVDRFRELIAVTLLP